MKNTIDPEEMKKIQEEQGEAMGNPLAALFGTGAAPAAVAAPRAAPAQRVLKRK